MRRKAGAAICASACAQSRDRPPGQSPEAFLPFLQVIQQVRLRDQPYHRRLADHARGGRLRLRRDARPEVGLDQYGHDEFSGSIRCWSASRSSSHDWERPYLEGSRVASSATPSPIIETILATCDGNGTRFRNSNANDIGPSSTNAGPFLSIAGSSSPRSSCRACSGFSAGSARIPRMRPYEAHRRPDVSDRINKWSRAGCGGATRCPIAAMSGRWGREVRAGSMTASWDPARASSPRATPSSRQVRGIIENLGPRDRDARQARSMLA